MAVVKNLGQIKCSACIPYFSAYRVYWHVNPDETTKS